MSHFVHNPDQDLEKERTPRQRGDYLQGLQKQHGSVPVLDSYGRCAPCAVSGLVWLLDADFSCGGLRKKAYRSILNGSARLCYVPTLLMSDKSFYSKTVRGGTGHHFNRAE